LSKYRGHVEEKKREEKLPSVTGEEKVKRNEPSLTTGGKRE